MDDLFVRLEIGIAPAKPGSDRYALSMHFSQPGSEADVTPLGDEAVVVRFKMEDLLKYAALPDRYGACLSKMFFADARVLLAFDRARSAARLRNVPLRVCLLFALGTEKLRELAWETLLDPEDNRPLFQKENVLLSRVINRTDSRQVVLPARRELRALLFVADPKPQIAGLDPIKVTKEIEQVKGELACLDVTVVPGAENPRATFKQLFDVLRSGEEDGYDILYIVCHGVMVAGTFWLILENEAGEVDKVPGEAFTSEMQNLARQPLLVVISACKSAQQIQGGYNGFAAGLAAAGVPAVLAMQKDFSFKTAAVFMPTFFKELVRTGQIDQAVSIARRAVQSRIDFWIPALFTCLKSGRIWNDQELEPGAADVTYVQINANNIEGDNNQIINIGPSINLQSLVTGLALLFGRKAGPKDPQK